MHEAHGLVFLQSQLEICVCCAHSCDKSVSAGKLRRVETVLVGLELLLILLESVDVVL
jgi:hypothetical protein